MKTIENYLPSKEHANEYNYGYYYKSGIFAQYMTKRTYNHYSKYQWKTHINYPVLEPEKVKRAFLKDILFFLQKNDIKHKIVIDERDIIYRMNSSKEENTQNGKIITIYYNNEYECYWSMDRLDRLIREKGYIQLPLHQDQQFRNDRLFRNNPYIGYRYASTSRKPYYIHPVDEMGRQIEDIQEKYEH